MNIIFEAPLNQLSFGNVAYNFLREFYRIQQNDSSFKFTYFPAGTPDISAFDSATPDFKKWLQSIVDNRYSNLSKDAVNLKLWHINGAEKRISSRQVLYSFYELDQPTLAEKSILNLQDASIFSSSYASNAFKDAGVANVSNIPIGFDEDIKPTGKSYLSGKTHFLLMGKYEKRKHTDKIIKLWAKKFGNNSKYQLTCCIINPFFDKELMKKLIVSYRTLANNINILPYVATNSEVNDILNSVDIDLSGLSGAEGWGLPAFNCTCLGKWSVVLNATSHKDWATRDNSILVEPSGKIEAYDNTFFKKDGEFNQGHIYDFNDDEAMQAIEKAAAFAANKVVNTAGIETGQKFTYRNTVSQICDVIARL